MNNTVISHYVNTETKTILYKLKNDTYVPFGLHTMHSTVYKVGTDLTGYSTMPYKNFQNRNMKRISVKNLTKLIASL